MEEEILRGVQHRINELTQALAVFRENNLNAIADEYEARLDENESLLYWIKEMNEATKCPNPEL